MAHSEAADCPACGSTGLLEGDEVVNEDVHYPSALSFTDEEPERDYRGDGSVTLTIAADYFSCPGCQLVLTATSCSSESG